MRLAGFRIAVLAAAFTVEAAGMELTDIADRTRSATVLLTVYDADRKTIAIATGFFVSEDGVAVTNRHAIEAAKTIIARTANGDNHAVEGVVAQHMSRDVVLLKVAGSKFSFLRFEDSGHMRVGQQVAVVGNPLGLEGTLSEGILAAKRELDGEPWLQITAAISPGSSGSPVVDSEGMVVGVATLLLLGGESLNFAIPSKHHQLDA